MKLIFERGAPDRGMQYLPQRGTPNAALPEHLMRKQPARLPEVSEIEVGRHYAELAKQVFGVVSGFYPLGSCTMKYNPRINERVASLPGFASIHPLQKDAAGCEEVLRLSEELLCEITGMDAMSFQPSAGAHGELLGLMLIKKYHEERGDLGRSKIIIPDAAHGTNPASAAMAGFEVVNVLSDAHGCVDMEAFGKVLGDDVAGLMLTNPNTLGLFDPNVLEITSKIHACGGLCYYDGANLNAIMGHVRPGDMGFDVVHLNLHKTFSTPHGGGGPGSGPVGCKHALSAYLPGSALFGNHPDKSVGQVRAFHGNFGVVVRELTYILTLGAEGIREASQTAVLNANYLMHKIRDDFDLAYDHPCMHEFVLTLGGLKASTGVSAMDVAKGLIDHGMHPPTMYFPLIVHEALMVEPTETESPETLDKAAEAFHAVRMQAQEDPESLHRAPVSTPIGRPDDVAAARDPVLRYNFQD